MYKRQVFVRKKTSERDGSERTLLISSLMRAIMERWGNPRSPGAHVFRQLNDCVTEEERVRKIGFEIKAANMHLKAMCADLGIADSHKISTYAARHSFASHAVWAGRSVHFVQDRLGHQNPQTTMHYIKSLGLDMLEKSMDFMPGYSG